MKKKYKQIENMLSEHKGNKCELRDLEIEMSKLKNDYDGINPICYEERTSTSNSFSSVVESEILRREERIQMLERLRAKLTLDVSKIENAMDLLTAEEKNIITEKYINGLQWWQVSRIVNFSPTHAKRIRRNAINKMIQRIRV